jgi:uncharacterized membrane protein YqjE
MVGTNHNSSSNPLAVLGRLGRAALRGLQTRVELMAVEWQEERLRLAHLLVRAIALVFLGTMGTLLVTATIIFLFPEGLRVYVTAALGILYLIGAAVAWAALKAGLSREPFAESIEQVKKDRIWLESLK